MVAITYDIDKYVKKLDQELFNHVVQTVAMRYIKLSKGSQNERRGTRLIDSNRQINIVRNLYAKSKDSNG